MKKQIVLSIAVFAFIANLVSANVIFNDGGDHTIYTLSPETVQVKNSPGFFGMPTTLNLMDGYSDASIMVENTSILNFHNGTVANVNPTNSSCANIYGGTIDRLFQTDTSKCYIYGGIVNVLSRAGYTSGATQTYVLGGKIGSFSVGGTGQVFIYGGEFISGPTMSGASSWTFYGTDFAIDGKPVNYQIFTSTGFNLGRLTGTFLDGISFSTDFALLDSATITLAIPEPCTLLLLGLGGVLIRKR